MGVDFALFERLVELSTRFQPKGRVLCLGRQSFRIFTSHKGLYTKILERHNRPESRFDFLQEDGFSETLLRKLGFGEAETMDFSAYEGASILHDLNHLPPSELEGEFDLIIDGGTIEHVFNVPNALEGVFRMLKPGGRFLSLNGLNGFVSHGMYQFTPEIVWTFWKRACNCRIIDCRAIPCDPKSPFGHIVFEDPATLGRRLRTKGKIGPRRTYLYYEVEKTEASHLPVLSLQSDYETKWHGSENAGQTRLDRAS